MSAYAGHCSDGSSIQRHSVGPIYPQIIGYQEGQMLPWFVMRPDGEIYSRHANYTAAYAWAEAQMDTAELQCTALPYGRQLKAGRMVGLTDLPAAI